LLAEQKAGGYSTKYRFTGKEVDEETGLYYFGARYYDPRISVWYGVDPLTEDGLEYSPYIYTFNNPIIYTDPDGKWPDPPAWLKEAAANTTAFVAGAVNAVSSNMLAGAGRGDPNQFGNYAQAAEYGQTTGDVIAAAVGIVETAVGFVGGAAAVAFALPSGGATALATPVATAAVVHGAATTTTALSNLASPSKVEARKTPTEKTNKRIESIKQRQQEVKHTTSKSKSSNDKHTKVRPGERTGDQRNSNKGDKNKKFKQDPNPNKRVKNDKSSID